MLLICTVDLQKGLMVEFIEWLIESDCISGADAGGLSGRYHHCPLSNPLAGTGRGSLTTQLQLGNNNTPERVRVCASCLPD